MFVIEKFLNDLRAREEAWERACEKWVKGGGEYDYRTKRDYRSNHPRPTDTIKYVVKMCITAVAVAICLFLLFGFAREIAENQRKQPKKEETAQTDKNCQRFNKDDHVRVQYGDYAGVTGRLIGGCEGGQIYQVKLDDNQKAQVPNDGHSEEVEVGGRTIGVDNENNLVQIDDKKE